MLIIAGILRINKPATDDILEVCRVMMETTSKEDGCLDYVFSFDPVDPEILHIYERWESQEALEAHFAAPHMIPFREAIANWDITKQDILQFDDVISKKLR